MPTNTRAFITSLLYRQRLRYVAHRRKNVSITLAKRYIARRLSARRYKKHPWLLLVEFPLDIIHLVFGLLPLASQACLALTCKPLYALFGHVLADESLAWPRQPRTVWDLMICGDPDFPRNQLVLLLEDGYWVYCSRCLKLHPRSRFTSSKRAAEGDDRWCKYMARVLDLCPCVALTFYDKVRLVECLRKGTMNPDLPPSIRHAFRLSTYQRQRCLLHECAMYDYESMFVNLKTRIILQGRHSIVLKSTYHLYFNLPPRYPRTNQFHCSDEESAVHQMEPLPICPDLNVLDNLFGTTTPEDGCLLCGTEIVQMGMTVDGSFAVVECSRNIGGKDSWIKFSLGGRRYPNVDFRNGYLRHSGCILEVRHDLRLLQLNG
ncbi:hypothetical protein BJX68DRAFT_264711 [Aspergillus pseudodeflectus]|uniref:F-box domain-containing protein n=1 Tax=Aspergillus pseudodeflectus TaxID=176178 RepID=A0ABR4KNV5_9EURO